MKEEFDPTNPFYQFFKEQKSDGDAPAGDTGSDKPDGDRDGA